MADDKKKKEKKHWFKDLRTELKKVTWLTPKQLFKNTTAVIVMVLLVALIVFVLDFVFEALNSQGVEKLKGFVQSNQTVQIEEATNQIDETTTAEDNGVVVENEETENSEENTNTEENNVVEE